MTHDSNSGDTSSNGHAPDGIPINFTTNFGTIIGTSYTVKGKANTILNLGTLLDETVTNTASLDNQTVSTTGLICTGDAVLTVTSTAIDYYWYNLPLNYTCIIPLTDPVTCVSVIATPYIGNGYPGYGYFGGYPADILRVTIDGVTWLETLIYDPNWTTDILTVNLDYPGVSGFNINVTDPNSTNVTSLNFPGDVIQRTSTLTYTGSPYDSIQSFALVTTDVTNNVVQYWLNQSSNYQSDPALNAAYNAFLTSLMLVYLHDQIADNLSSVYNVTWSRTSPIVVSVGEDATGTYLTLDCDHSMGMTVTGAIADIWAFNYATSSCIPVLEDAIMNSVINNGTYNSVMTNLINDYLNNMTSVEVSIQNGYIIEESGNDFIVIDPETGICRDINTVNNLCGAWEDIMWERWWLSHSLLFPQLLPLDPSQLFNNLLNGYDQLNTSPALRKLYYLGAGAFEVGDGLEFLAFGGAAFGIGLCGEPEDNLAGIGGIVGGIAAMGYGTWSFNEGMNHMTEGWNDPWN